MKSLFANKCETEYFDTLTSYSYTELSDCITKYLAPLSTGAYTPVILCIGTDRATGDCLGPLVGQFMQDFHANYKVIGNLSSPVHALNLRQTISYIYNNIPNPFIIAVDASLGLTDHVGNITVSNCPISPGKGVNKKLPAVGDVSITGIVNVSGQNPALLQSTRLHIVMQLADCIANALKTSIRKLEGYMIYENSDSLC